MTNRDFKSGPDRGMTLADVGFQLASARHDIDHRLYLRAACKLDGAAHILRLVKPDATEAAAFYEAKAATLRERWHAAQP